MNNKIEVKWMMKKWIGALIVVAIFLGGSFATYRYYYMGETYYTKITTNGERHTEGDRKNTYYTYKQAAYNEEGQEKEVSFNELRERPLKMSAYLKLEVNERKGVLNWEEVKLNEIPKAAAQQLE